MACCVSLAALGKLLCFFYSIVQDWRELLRHFLGCGIRPFMEAYHAGNEDWSVAKKGHGMRYPTKTNTNGLGMTGSGLFRLGWRQPRSCLEIVILGFLT